MNAAYREYLASPWWQLRRHYELERVDRCCEFCGDDMASLNVHHLSYERLGRELPHDLIVLCRWCHQDAHDFPGTIGSDIWQLAERRELPNTLEEMARWLEQVLIPSLV